MRVYCTHLSLFYSALLVLAGAVCALAEDASPEPVSPEVFRFFEGEVRPLLVEKCFKCHGEEKQSGELRLDGPASLLAGGESGAAIVPGKPDESLLIEAINYSSYEMPPDGKLSDEQIAILTKWVALGAPWPGATDVLATVHKATNKITDEDREFWSFRPMRLPEVPAATGPSLGDSNEIDSFVAVTLAEQNLTLSEPASPATLVRRVYLDLIGLPPSLEQVDAFLADPSSVAYARLVDELLSSPRYGENQARLWLDLVRYADSDGYKADYYRPNAWRYRDYVIGAFNADMPYDRFVAEQLAGDELAPNDPQAVAATGFLRHGIYEYNQRDALTHWQDMLNDITDTTSDVFLGLGMGCARCHDHKFDPILQKDYFRLQAFFANIQFTDEAVHADTAALAEYRRRLETWESATFEVRARLAEIEEPLLKSLGQGAITAFAEEIQAIYNKPDAEKTSYDRQITHLIDLQVIEAQGKLDTKIRKEDKERYAALKEELASYDALRPDALPVFQSVRDFGPTPPPMFIPGKERLGAVEPGFLTIFEPEPAAIAPLPDVPATSGRRSTLAQWLTRPDHPLTARVMVNRIWQQHFGRGIVATPSDFGHLGEQPSHPELLDWLAIQFVESGWSIKQLHRRIVLSAAYRQSSLRIDPQATKLDPQNRLLWRQNIRRLDAEQIRDAMLAVSGELDTSVSNGEGRDWSASSARSVFSRVMRNSPDEVLESFDFPDRIRSTGERNVTVSPNQSLLLINGGWTLGRATVFASRIANDGGLDSQIRDAVRLALGRDATPAEVELLGRHAENSQAGAATSPLADICHVLLNSNEFLYID